MRAGRLDRLIAIQEPQKVTQPDGEVVKSWAEVNKVWAEKKDVLLKGQEQFEGQQDLAEFDTVWRIRYVNWITSEHRIVYDGKAYDIHSFGEVGRRAYAFLEIRTTVKPLEAA